MNGSPGQVIGKHATPAKTVVLVLGSALVGILVSIAHAALLVLVASQSLLANGYQLTSSYAHEPWWFTPVGWSVPAGVVATGIAASVLSYRHRRRQHGLICKSGLVGDLCIGAGAVSIGILLGLAVSSVVLSDRIGEQYFTLSVGGYAGAIVGGVTVWFWLRRER